MNAVRLVKRDCGIHYGIRHTGRQPEPCAKCRAGITAKPAHLQQWNAAITPKEGQQ